MGVTPDCETCIPDLLPGNEDVMLIYNDVMGQFIMGPGGPIDIDLNAVYRSMNEHGIPDELQPEVKTQVRGLVHTMLKEWEKDNKVTNGV